MKFKYIGKEDKHPVKGMVCVVWGGDRDERRVRMADGEGAFCLDGHLSGLTTRWSNHIETGLIIEG